MFGDWTYWLLCVGVLAANAALVYVAWWALFADRPRGRRRCPRCWHNLDYTPGMTCSECGFTTAEERDFHRTRRRWKTGIGAILIAVALAAFIDHRMSTRGWVSVIPTKALILAMPLAGSQASPISLELGQRMRADVLSQLEWEWVAGRCAKGDWNTPPLSDDWVERYGLLIWRCRESWQLAAQRRDEDGERATGGDDDEAVDPLQLSAIEERLLDIPPRIDLLCRETWPEDLPVTVGVRLQDWWPVGMQARMRIRPRVEGAVTHEVVRGRLAGPLTAHALTLPALPRGTHEVSFEVEVERRLMRGGAAGEWETVASRTLSLPLAIEGGMDELLEPMIDEELADAVRDTFQRGVVKWDGGPHPVRFRFDPRVTFHSAFDDIAIGVRVDLLRDDELVRGLDIWWLAGNAIDDHRIGWQSEGDGEAALREVNDEDGRWAMRVTGRPELAMRAGGASEYWAGEVTIPLRVERIYGDAPPSHWWQSEEEGDGGSDEG